MKNLAGIKKYNCELNKAIKESLIDALYLLLKNKSNKKIGRRNLEKLLDPYL